jgi:hypothetical protein
MLYRLNHPNMPPVDVDSFSFPSLLTSTVHGRNTPFFQLGQRSSSFTPTTTTGPVRFVLQVSKKIHLVDPVTAHFPIHVPARALSICRPQPNHVGLPQFLHSRLLHIVPILLLRYGVTNLALLQLLLIYLPRSEYCSVSFLIRI